MTGSVQFLASSGSRTSITKNRITNYAAAIYLNGNNAASFMNIYEVSN